MPTDDDGEIARYAQEFAAIHEAFGRLVEGVDEEAFNRRPSPDRWSIGECLAHLVITADQYLPALDGAIERAWAARLTGTGPFQHGPIGNWFVRFMEPPVKTRVKAPGKFQPPRQRHSMDATVAAFRDRQNQFLARLRRASGLHLSRVKVRSPAMPLMRWSLGQTFALMAAHERRHLWQAGKVKEEIRGFPS